MSIKVEEFAYSNGEDDSRLEMERLIRLAKQEVLGKRGGSELLARLETIASSLQIQKTWLAYF
ncbi:MAG: hypothetical protein HKL80_10390, partial [Acidimicrobiales bacterium]|nr:hypothetical protein [Acidimicrobiales bacterium]